MREYRMPLPLITDFVCEGCAERVKGIVEPHKEMSYYDQMELEKRFSYLKTG